MQTIKIEGSIYYRTDKWIEGFDFWSIKPDSKFWQESSDRIFIAPYTIEIEAPDDIEKVIYGNKLNALQMKRKLILAENESRINEIDQEIQEHLAIEA